MSRSRKKTPKVSYTTSGSEKEDKQKNNRRLRKKVKQELGRLLFRETTRAEEAAADRKALPQMREVSNRWTMAKDGKWWCSKDILKKYPSFARYLRK